MEVVLISVIARRINENIFNRVDNELIVVFYLLNIAI